MIVNDNQTLFDIAIQATGSAEGAYAFAVMNGLSLTDELVAGRDLLTPDVINADIATYFQTKNIHPATLLTLQAQSIGAVVDALISDVPEVQSNLIRVMDGQTLFDIAIQEFGSIEAAFALATLNGISVTDNIIPGTLLQKTLIVDKRIVNYYGNKQIKPATAITEAFVPEGDDGIGYWAIGFDFIVS